MSIAPRHRMIGWLLMALCACAAPPVPDYEDFYSERPFTVVVPPVVNQTADAEAPRFFLATITKPLADRGYYVIPVQATAEILASEGLADGGALAAVDPVKLGEYFGADAVLYVTLTAWDTAYLIFSASVTVAAEYRLVSTRTGQMLWSTSHDEVITSNPGGGVGLAGLVSALANAAATAAGTDYVPMVMDCNLRACSTLPSGPYHPLFEQEKERNLARARRAAPDAP